MIVLKICLLCITTTFSTATPTNAPVTDSPSAFPTLSPSTSTPTLTPSRKPTSQRPSQTPSKTPWTRYPTVTHTNFQPTAFGATPAPQFEVFVTTRINATSDLVVSLCSANSSEAIAFADAVCQGASAGHCYIRNLTGDVECGVSSSRNLISTDYKLVYVKVGITELTDAQANSVFTTLSSDDYATNGLTALQERLNHAGLSHATVVSMGTVDIAGPPSRAPSLNPSIDPTLKPTGTPSLKPSANPSADPSTKPSAKPSTRPSGKPSERPTAHPSSIPSHPTIAPTKSVPTNAPSSSNPSKIPTQSLPSQQPTIDPSEPTNMPTTIPTSGIPTPAPTPPPTSSSPTPPPTKPPQPYTHTPTAPSPSPTPAPTMTPPTKSPTTKLTIPDVFLIYHPNDKEVIDLGHSLALDAVTATCWKPVKIAPKLQALLKSIKEYNEDVTSYRKWLFQNGVPSDDHSPNGTYVDIYRALRVLSTDTDALLDSCRRLRNETLIQEIADDSVQGVYDNVFNETAPLNSRIAIWKTLLEAGAKKDSIIALHDRLMPFNKPTEVFTKACRDYDDGRYFTEWWVREYNEYKVVQEYMRRIDLIFVELEQPTIDMKEDSDQLLALLPLELKEMGAICKTARNNFGMETLADLEKDWWAEMRQNILPSDKGKSYWAAWLAESEKLNKDQVKNLIESDESFWISMFNELEVTKATCAGVLTDLGLPPYVIYDQSAMRTWIQWQESLRRAAESCDAHSGVWQGLAIEKQEFEGAESEERSLDASANIVPVNDLEQSASEACDSIRTALIAENANETNVDMAQLQLGLLNCRDKILDGIALMCEPVVVPPEPNSTLDATSFSRCATIENITNIGSYCEERTGYVGKTPTFGEISLFHDGSYICIEEAYINAIQRYLQPELDFCSTIQHVDFIKSLVANIEGRPGINDSISADPANMTHVSDRLKLNLKPFASHELIADAGMINYIGGETSKFSHLQIHVQSTNMEIVADAIKLQIEEHLDWGIEVLPLNLSVDGKAFLVRVEASKFEVMNNLMQIKKLMRSENLGFDVRAVQVTDSLGLQQKVRQSSMTVEDANFCTIDTKMKKAVATHSLGVIDNTCVCEEKWLDSKFCGELEQMGCVNCNSDPKGNWCYVKNKGCDTDEGTGWAYCTPTTTVPPTEQIDAMETTEPKSDGEIFTLALMILLIIGVLTFN